MSLGAFVVAGFFGLAHEGNIAVACSIAGLGWGIIDIWAQRDYRRFQAIEAGYFAPDGRCKACGLNCRYKCGTLKAFTWCCDECRIWNRGR